MSSENGGSERKVAFIYLCESCDHEVATTSTIAGPFEAPPSIYCPCSDELREMEPMEIANKDRRDISIPFAGDGTVKAVSSHTDSDADD